MNTDNPFTRRLVRMGMGEIPARKAAEVLSYYGQIHEDGSVPVARGIGRIWKGMQALELEPYVERDPPKTDLLAPEYLTFQNLESIESGVAECISCGLLEICDRTKYALSPRGVEFLRPEEREEAVV